MAVSFLKELGVLRARIESEITRPAVLAVTSARRGDGKSVLAEGLAASLASAGYATLLVDAAVEDESPRGYRAVPKLVAHQDFDPCEFVTERRAGEADVLGLFSNAVGSTATLESVKHMLVRCRARYDYTVVDTSPAIDSPLGLLFSASSDAILIAFQRGRAGGAADRELLSNIRSTSTPVLGVVTVTARAIERHAGDSVKGEQALIKPRKRAEEAKVAPPLVSTR